MLHERGKIIYMYNGILIYMKDCQQFILMSPGQWIPLSMDIQCCDGDFENGKMSFGEWGGAVAEAYWFLWVRSIFWGFWSLC